MATTISDRLPYPAGQCSTLIELLHSRALNQPDRDAYIYLVDGETKESRLTYRALHEQASAIGAHLQSLEMKGERAVLLYPPGLEFIGAFFGCLYAGIVPVPAYPPDTSRLNRSLPRLEGLLFDAKAKLTLTSKAILTAAQPLFEKLTVSKTLLSLATDDLDLGLASTWREPDVNQDNLAFLQYTSGSTGSPRGVMLSHRNLLHNASLVYRAMEHTDQDRYVSWLPTFHDMGFMAGVLEPLYAGIPAILLSPISFLQKPLRWLKAITKYRGTTSGGPNFAYDLCVRKITPDEFEMLDLSSWTVAFNGSEPIRSDSLERFIRTFESRGFCRETFYPCYGLAEATLIVSGGRKYDPPLIIKADLADSRAGGAAETGAGKARVWVGCGRSLSDQKVIIVDPESLIERPPGAAGEIWVSGPSVAEGYWNRPEETEQTFNAYLPANGEGPFLRTGDLGFLQAGELCIAGRLKDLIIIRGHNHYPQDLELTVEQCHPALRPGCGAAFSVDVAGEERLVVVHEIDERAPLDPVEIMGRIQQAITEAHGLQACSIVLIKVGTIFKTSSGKIQRHACRAAFEAGSLDVVAEYGAPANTETENLAHKKAAERRRVLEEKLSTEMASLLGLPVSEIDVNKSLTRYGLDSLRAIEIEYSFEQLVGVSPPLSRFLEGASISQLLSEALALAGDASLKPQTELAPSTTAPEFYPLSEGQKGLWFLHRLMRDNTAYSITRALRITTTLDIEALQRAFQALVDRHRCLRTAFHEIDGEPVQQIEDRLEFTFRSLDATDWSDEEVSAHLANEAAQPFDLDRPPLFRVELLLRSERDQILFLNIHHIVADFWSLSILIKELVAIYEAEKNHAAIRLRPLPLEYTDYVRNQAEMLAGAEGERLWRYWQERLGGETPILNLPTDHPRPSAHIGQGHSGQGGVVHFRLGQQLTGRLKKLSRELEITLYTMLLAGFNALLHRYTGQPEIFIGAPTVGRRNPLLAGLIGYFVNPVALRSNLSGNPTFGQLAERMRPDVLSALEHSGYPLPLLVKKLRPADGQNVSPLFQVMFSLQNVHIPDQQGLGSFALGVEGGKLQIGELSFESMSIAHCAPQFDLTMMMCEENGALKAKFEYNAALFEGQTIERLAGHFRQLFESICLHPDRRIGRLQYLPEAELRQLLYDWNQHSKAPVVNPGFLELFQRQVDRAPDAVALVSGAHALTYRELNARANQLANHLQRRGAGPELPVAVCLGRTPEMIIALIAILKSGSPYLPLDPAYPADRLRFMLDDSHAVLIVAERQWADAYASDARLVRLDLDWPGISAEPETKPESNISPGHLAYLIYTSGSTGRPKGVLIEHRSLTAFLHWVRDELSDQELSGVLASTSICFDLSVFEIFGALSWGGTLILVENALQLAGMSTATAASVRVINTVPSAIRELLRLEAIPDSGLTITLCGEPLDPSLARGLYQQAQASRVVNLYGPSEDTTYSTLSRILPGDNPDVTIGRGITGTQVYLLDSDMETVGIGITGEIYLGGAGLARGYWGRPEITAERFLPDPFRVSVGGRLYRTGDLGRVRPDGEIEFLGRSDHQVKVRGHRVELGEIESVILSHPEVAAAAVLARENGREGAQLVAYVVERDGADIGGAQLKQYVGTMLPDYMAPQAVIKLSQLPVTPNGKLDRRRLPAPDELEVAAADNGQGPRDGVEEMLAEIWREVLGVKRVGTDDNFFELGGHSLLATQLVARVRKIFGVEAELRAVFECRSLAEMSDRIVTRLRGGHRIETPPIGRGNRTGHTGRTGPAPLSDAQRRLWFIDQMGAAPGLYNMSGVLRLRGRLNLQALEESLNRIIDRHESLRTSFPAIDGAPVQRIAAPFEFSLSPLDLQSEPDPERAAADAARADARHPFDLRQGPLLRCRLLRLAADHHQLLITMHHIISDGWSVDLFIRELKAIYQALSQDTPIRLPDLPIQYADYALWQTAGSNEQQMRPALTYWKTRLGGDLAELALPTDHPRPVVPTFNGASVSLFVAEDETQVIKAFGYRRQASLFMTLLAAFNSLLHRYTGQEDFAVGTPVANRNRLELEGLIGCFVNTLVLRTDLSGGPTFGESLARVRETALGAYAYQDLPFERLVEELSPERSLSHSPLFQTLFVLQPPSARRWTLGEVEDRLELELIEIENGTAKFDLTLTVKEEPDGLELRFEYSADLFDRWRMEQMARHYLRLLRSVIDDPVQLIGWIDLLEEAERRQILEDWNRTDQEIPQATIPNLFEEQVRKSPEAVALVHEEQKLTYRELNEQANRLAHRLRELGVEPEARVAIILGRSAGLVVAQLAVLKCGAAYVPIDPSFPAERQVFMTTDCAARAVITTLNATLPEAGATLRVEIDDLSQFGAATDNLNLPSNGEMTAYVMYTSGSTGRPKGVMIPHRGIARLVLNCGYADFNPSDRVAFAANPAFDASTMEVWAPLLNGGRIVIIDRETFLDPGQLAQKFEQHGITTLFLTTAVFNQYAQAIPEALARLRYLLCGGERNDPASFARLLEQAGPQHLIHCYGPTETTTFAITHEVTEVSEGAKSIPLGRPIANTQIYILDVNRQPAPIGVAGEIYIGGAGVALGYLNRPELTDECFLPNPFSPEPEARMYKTGDLGRWLPNGRIEFLGRNDFQVKIRGFRIEPGEIESTLAAYPGVREAVVLTREDGEGSQRLIAYYTGDEAEVEALRNHLSRALPEYMAPAAYAHLESLPLTSNGKLDRQTLQALPVPEGQAYLTRGYQPPEGEIETCLAYIWADLLRLERVSRFDNFFELGGHSLLTVQLLSRVRQTLGVDMPLADLFAWPVLSDFALTVARASQSNLPPITPIDRNNRNCQLELSFAQQRLWFLSQFQGASRAYHISGGLRLVGDLDRSALRRALNQIFARHEVLRTTFSQVDGRPIQVIGTAETGFHLQEHDLRQDADPVAALQQLAADEVAHPFDLEHGPLIRGRLARLADDDHALLVTMHHIIADGWSIGILVNELGAAYQAYCEGKEAGLPELPVQYADYAAWQRSWLQGAVLENQLAYWRRQLSGELSPLKLPTDKHRPAIQTYRGMEQSYLLPVRLSNSLKALSLERSCTLFMTLLAAFKTLLYYLTGQTDICVGTDIANRNHAAIEKLIGLFVNQLVLRTKLSPDSTFEELLKKVREITLGAYAHQDLPFEKLIEALNPKRDANRTPLFQVKMALQNAPIDKLTLSGLKLSPIATTTGAAKLDLLLNLTDTEQGLSATLQYDTDLFDERICIRILSRFRTLLYRIVEQPDARLGELVEWLIEEDKREALEKDSDLESVRLRTLKGIKRRIISEPHAEVER
jgi:amino acid adenylation domain-containing protein